MYEAISNDADTGTFADFMEGLKTFDREGQGFVSCAELRNLLTMMGMLPVIEVNTGHQLCP